MAFEGYTTRYAAYCKAHCADNAPEMLNRDGLGFPGGKMAGFINWIAAQWRAWADSAGKGLNATRSAADHVAFDRWLSERFARPQVIARMKAA